VFDGRWRAGVDRVVKPVGSALRHAGITADQLTGVGLVLAALTAIAIGAGQLRLGLLLLVLAAVPDLLDGAVAKAAGTASPRGAFFDSVADRVTDSLVLGGVAWHLADHPGGRAPLLPFAVLAASTLVSYQRAKAESIGLEARGGLMERAERIAALCLGLALPALLVPVLWAMLALTTATAVQRFVKVWRQASAPRPPREPASRWWTWREAAGLRERHHDSRSPSQWGPSARWRSRRQERRTARPWRRPGRGVRP
jgi:CDP-diacylglycerol--glycerol-3-phosphate 3-phosphatidyltransferase